MPNDPPSSAEDWLKEAISHHRQGRLAEAETAYRGALELAPDNLGALINLGAALSDLGREEEAEHFLRRALNLVPDDRDALNNLGNAALGRDRTEEAAEHFRRALAADGDNPVINANLARALLRKSDVDGAVAALDKALAAAPEDGGARVVRALALPFVARSADHLAACRERLEAETRALAGSGLTLADPLSEVGMTNFLAAYHGRDDCELQTRIADIYRDACPALSFTAPHCGGKKRAGGKIRIGFVSANFAGHTIGRLNRGLMTRLDDEQFEVSVFSFGRDRRGADAIIDAIATGVEHLAFLPPDLAAARQIIAAAELDILYYTDIGMEPATYFLAFSRLADVQCVTVGHPVTTGISTLDYFISHDLAEPQDAAAHYSEKLVRLPDFPSYYYFPDLPGIAKGRDALGLDFGRNLYLCPQSLFKLHPDFDAILGAILEGDRDGIVILIAGPQTAWSDILRRRFAATIAGAAARIRFVPRLPGADFIHLLAAADVILDTPHFSGGNTSFEAFALAKPVVTLPGATLRSRVTAGLYAQMDIAGGTAGDARDYARIALALGTGASAREELGAAIAGARDAIFEREAAVDAQADFFREAVNR